MAEDLVIDIGIPQNTKEFDSFVRCIQNILKYGCGYDDDFTEEILEKCRKSELDIAKQVISELEKPRSQYSRRKGKLKWWEEYRPRRKSAHGCQSNQRHRGRQNDQRHHDQRHRDQRHRGRQNNDRHREQRLSFERPRQDRRQRPMSPMFEGSKNNNRYSEQKVHHKRQQSPMSGRRRQQRYHEQKVNRKRPMSPMFDRHDDESDVPEWPSRNKKRKFR